MIDTKHFGTALGISLGVPLAVILTVLLLLLGHSWWSLLALPITPLVCAFLGSLLDRM